MHKFILPVLLIFLLFSCNNDEINQKTQINTKEFDGKINNAGKLDPDSGEYKVFTLPTPLQLPTILKLYNYDFNESFLAPLNNNYLSYNNFQRAINTGIYGINLGYCTMYEQPKFSINYFERVKTLINVDDFNNIINDSKSEKFQRNINNVDSLSKLILEAYYDLHLKYQDKEEEGYGLIVLSGAFVEGLYMSTHNSNIPNVKRHYTIIAQQKIFLTNIISLLDYYANSIEVSNLLKELVELALIFDEFEINYNDITGSISNNLTTDTYTKIELKIEIIRNSILND